MRHSQTYGSAPTLFLLVAGASNIALAGCGPEGACIKCDTRSCESPTSEDDCGDVWIEGKSCDDVNTSDQCGPAEESDTPPEQAKCKAECYKIDDIETRAHCLADCIRSN